MKVKGWQIYYDAVIYDDEDWYGNSHHNVSKKYSDTIYKDKDVAKEEMSKINKRDIFVGCGLTSSHVTDIYLREVEIDIV